jgi:hypothetical protein
MAQLVDACGRRDPNLMSLHSRKNPRRKPAGSVAIDFFAVLGARQRAALIREWRLPSRQSQTVSFDEHAVAFGLGPGKKANKHEGSAKHQPYQHHPTVRAFVVKIHDTTNNSSGGRTTECSD